MYIERKTKTGLNALIIVNFHTEQRLRSTCYRGRQKKLAGNFMDFFSSDDLLQNRFVLQKLLDEMEYLWEGRKFRGTHRLSIICPDFIGWESTVPMGNFTEADLEEFCPNEKSDGLRVKPERTDLRAPKTKELTLVFEFKAEGDDPVVMIHSVYPGKDIGGLYGHVSRREGRIFFSWDHPGED